MGRWLNTWASLADCHEASCNGLGEHLANVEAVGGMRGDGWRLNSTVLLDVRLYQAEAALKGDNTPWARMLLNGVMGRRQRKRCAADKHSCLPRTKKEVRYSASQGVRADAWRAPMRPQTMFSALLPPEMP